jgi:hypothetical protein
MLLLTSRKKDCIILIHLFNLKTVLELVETNVILYITI